MSFSYSFHLSSKSHAVNTAAKAAQVSRHNLRQYESDEYDRDQIQILRGSESSILDSVKQIYHDEFDAALEVYNSGKRPDRQIADYLKHVSDSRSDVACEIIIQLGDKDFWHDKTSDERRQMSKIFKDQLRYLEELVPELKVASAVIHYDESSPHMHIVGVPVASGYSKGLEKQVAKTKVFTANRLRFLQDQMRDRAEKGMQLPENSNLFSEINLKTKEKGRNKDIPKSSLDDFKALEKEAAELSAAIALKRVSNDLLQSVEMPAGKQNFTGKTVFTAEEYESLSAGLESLKTQISVLDANLDAAHKRIQSGTEENLRLNQTLDEKNTELTEVKLEYRLLQAKADPDRYEAVEVPAEWCRESRFNSMDNIKQCFVRGFAFDIYERIGSRIRLFIDKLREYTQHKDSQDFKMSGSKAAEQLRHEVREYDDLQAEKERKRQERTQHVSRKPRRREDDWER